MNHDGSESSQEQKDRLSPCQSENTDAIANTPASLIPSYGRKFTLPQRTTPKSTVPPRDSDEWKTEFNARTSVERSNKR